MSFALRRIIITAISSRLDNMNMFLRNALPCTKLALRCSRFQPQAVHQVSNRAFSIGLALKKEINVTFVRASGERIATKGKVGDSLLDVVVNNNIDLDGFGACEGTLTCSTCHLIFKPADYAKLPDTPGDEELDMLDLAYDLTDTSRLGCQITLTKEMDGLEVQVPSTINDARSA